jgi:GAF domain-containing protein
MLGSVAEPQLSLPLIDGRPVRQALPLAVPLPAAADPRFDHIAALVQRLLGVSAAAVSLVSVAEQVIPGLAGLAEPVASERCVTLDDSFCRHVVVAAEPLVIEDARGVPVLATIPPVTSGGVIAYAGVPLTDEDGTVVGSLCAVDDRPHAWTDRDLAVLTDLAAACSAELALRSAIEAQARLGERDRISLDLQGEVVRDLIGLSLQLSTARARATGEVDELLRVATEDLDAVLRRVRAIVYPA